MKTDEKIIQESLKCSKMYAECIKDAITKARESEREKVAEEIAILNAKLRELKRDGGCPNWGSRNMGMGPCEKCEWCLTYSDYANFEDRLDYCNFLKENKGQSCIQMRSETSKWCEECKKYLVKKEMVMKS